MAESPPSRLNPTPPPSSQAVQGTPAEQNVALEALKALNARGAAPTSHDATAPPDQKYVAYFEPDGTLAFTPNKNYDENAPKLTVYGSADSGYFRLDKQGNPVPVQQPNADALIDKAVDRQVKEENRNAAQRNLEKYNFYGNDVDRAKWENDMRARGLDADRIKLERDKYNTDAQQKALEEKRLSDLAVASIAKTGADIGQIGATTALTGAQTTQVGAQTAALQQKTPSEIEENLARAGLAGAQTDLAKVQAEEARRKGQLPTIEDLGTGATYGVMGPTGQIEERYRQGYVPKTLGEVQARIGQIDALAKQKQAELMSKVTPADGPYPPEKAYADFQKWHAANVQPHIQSLQVAGEEAALTRGKEIATMRTAAQTAALGAGTLAQRAISDQQARTVSNDYLGEMGKVWNATAAGERAGPIDYTKLARPDRDVAGEVAKATAEALKYIDPTAAQMTGTAAPTWMNTNPQAALNMTSLWGQPPAAAGAAGPAPVGTQGSTVAMPQDPNFKYDPRFTPEGPQQQPGTLLAPGVAGTVAPGDPRFLGTNAADVAAQQAAAQAQTDADLAALMAEQQANDVYNYGGAPAAAPNPMAIARRGVRRPGAAPVAAPAPPPTVVNPAPFYQQALAAGLGGGGAQWTPSQPPQFWPVGDETNPGPNPNQGYVPQPYVYGGMYATPTPY